MFAMWLQMQGHTRGQPTAYGMQITQPHGPKHQRSMRAACAARAEFAAMPQKEVPTGLQSRTWAHCFLSTS